MKRALIGAAMAATVAGGAAGVSQAPAAAQMTNEAAIQAIEAGRAAANRKDWAGALAQFKRAMTNPDLAPMARFYTGLTREQMGDQAAAMADYQAVLEMKGLRGDVQTAVIDRLVAIGFERLKKDDNAAAEAALKPAANTGRFDALHLYTVALSRQQKWEDAEKASLMLLDISPASVEGWTFLHEAQRQMAQAAAADPARAAEAAKLVKKTGATAATMNALPIGIKGLRIAEMNGTSGVIATMIGVAAPAGSWCIVDFSLDMGNKKWRAHTLVTAPAPGQEVEIRAPALGTAGFGAPAATERVYNLRYPTPYCEAAGGAAVTPPGAKKASLKGCPDMPGDIEELLKGREPIGTSADPSNQWRKHHSYPAGGITLFGTKVTRLLVYDTGNNDIKVAFGLPGALPGYSDRFKSRYDDIELYCLDGGSCGGELKTPAGYGLSRVDLEATEWPEGMMPKGTYLECWYEN